MSKAVVDYVYSHIGNGGITFKVTNENGPTIEVEAGHFGHTTNSIRLHADKETLKAIGEMFLNAAEVTSFSENYCCAPTSYIYDCESDKAIYNVNGESVEKTSSKDLSQE